jgi:hypothetical protein
LGKATTDNFHVLAVGRIDADLASREGRSTDKDVSTSGRAINAAVESSERAVNDREKAVWLEPDHRDRATLKLTALKKKCTIGFVEVLCIRESGSFDDVI